MSNTKIRTTISIEINTLNAFKIYCRDNGMKLSPRIELFMKAELADYEKKKNIQR